MSEAAIDAVEFDEPFVEEATETPETAAGTETAQEEKVETPEEKLAKLESVVKEKAFKEREAKREAEQLKERLAELQANQPKESRPNIPEVPDPFDDDYAEKIRQRDEALAKATAFDAKQQVLQEQAEAAQKQRQLQEQKALSERVTSYTERAAKLGVDNKALQEAGARVVQYGISDDIANYLLDHEQGPIITTYLSGSPMELEALRGMVPMQAAVYIESAIKDKALQLGVKKQTTAPEPVEHLSGAGASPKTPGLEGVKFE